LPVLERSTLEIGICEVAAHQCSVDEAGTLQVGTREIGILERASPHERRREIHLLPVGTGVAITRKETGDGSTGTGISISSARQSELDDVGVRSFDRIALLPA
jgi:hypothetical protein